ncbi:transmembrane protein, putative (macronuclear) [Tetrahymena thermophila SB210]|uniref:Transmembrane protein, putative n=1 Tax=Tetrahymena thermophila (strain SB210) TaxID=312017 RepID=Q23A02_TETTS|nr:transmembrane protein, putative [Tetrahymena thermophila SB210]EAR93361.1 transmembrane protein, putative [Tetrahymena thermophila SB210]|eukprot:XP_001013606.1 transmembrane protein, putative [Tetrahymena thermophila SB210]
MQDAQQDQPQIGVIQDIQGQDNPISLDDEQLYNLPQKIYVQISQQYQKRRKELSNEKQDLYTQEIQILVKKIDDVLEQHLYSWEKQKDWKFNLPKTAFEGDRAPIQFFQPPRVYGNQALNRLTPEQIASIKQTGQFVVNGNTEDSSTTWRLNSWIVRGKNYIKQCWFSGIGSCFHQLVQIKCRLGWRFAFNYHILQQILTPNFFDGFISIASVASKILNLTFGVRKVQKYNKNQIVDEIIRDWNKETIKMHHPEIKTSFFEFIFKNENDRKTLSEDINEQQKQEIRNRLEGFEKLTQDFEVDANKLEASRLSEFEEKNIEENDALFEIYLEKQKLLFSMIRSSKYIKDQLVQEHLIELITATQIVKRYYYMLEQELNNYTDQVSKEITERHQIRSRVQLWKNDKINELVQAKKIKLQKEFNQKIIKELNENKLDSYVVLFNRFVQFQEQLKSLYKQNYSRIQKKNTKPCRVFETFQQNMKPYRVLNQIKSNGQIEYFFDYGKTYKTPTSFFGWRLVLQLVRYKVWTKNTFVTLIDNLLNSYFGLKALFKLRPFYADQSLNRQTGQVVGCYLIYPYIFRLIESLKGIKRTIQDFEAQPDRGLFGKSFARIFKYIECLIRFVISISFVGVGVPVVILINSIVSFILAITSWAWIPVTLVGRWLIHLLLWDFDSPNRKSGYYYPENYQRYQTYQFLPLINTVLDLVLGTYQVGSSVASAFVLHPALSLLSFAKSIIRYVGQSISDGIMCKITSKLGRQPEIDTFIAWKIRGAGVTRQYSYSMDIEDVKFLMRAHLERIELEKYQQNLVEKIMQPTDIFQQLSRKLFQFYALEQPNFQVINSSIDLYMNILNRQIQQRKEKYPTLPNCNIKFTQEELSIIFFQCQNLIKNFVEPRKMEWIFKQYDVKPDDYKALTEKFLISIFSDENILYPISELDKRIEIKTQKSGNFDSIQRIIQGQTHINTFTASIQPAFKKYKSNFLFPFIQATDVQFNYQEKQKDYEGYYRQINPSCEAFNFNYKDYLSITQQIRQQQNVNN